MSGPNDYAVISVTMSSGDNKPWKYSGIAVEPKPAWHIRSTDQFPSRACCFSRILVFVSRLAPRSLVYVCNFADLSLGLLFWAVSYFHIDKSCTVFSSNKSHNTPHSSLPHFLQSSRTLQGRTGYGLFFPIIVITHNERHFMFIHSTLLYLSLDGVIPEVFIYLFVYMQYNGSCAD